MPPMKPSSSPDPAVGIGNVLSEEQLRAPARRRNRVIHACLECRRRKMKCGKGDPCENCSSSGRTCVYVNSANSDAEFRRKLAEMKEAKDSLDSRLLSHKRGSRRRKRTNLGDEKGSTDDSDSGSETGYLEPTPLAVQDAAHADGVDDDVDNLGVKIGRMWLGERIGGLYRPKIADEVWSSLEHCEKGPSPLAASPAGVSPQSQSDSVSTTPSMTILVGHVDPNIVLTDHLPPRYITDKLLDHYWIAVHPIIRIVHRPSFAQRYETLWECVEQTVPAIPSIAAIVYAVLLAASISLSEDEAFRISHTPRHQLQNQLKLGAETALSRAQLLKAFKVETLQAFVAYLLPMTTNQISRAHSVVTGMAVRLAECMGLHRDPTEFGFSPAECQTRRLIWYQICYLDLKTSELQGPRPFIHRDGYTTQLPLDVGLTSGPAWNDMIFTMIRFECQEMQRQCLTHRNRIDQRRLTVTKAVAKIEAFRVAMDVKYGPYIHGSRQLPMQRMAGVLLRLWVSMLYMIPLHRYMNSVTYRMPDRLRQIVLLKGTEMLEASVELETAEDFTPWKWYNAAYHTYHTALLLLVEVFNFPRRREATRIWQCLDFIFAEPLATVPNLQPAGVTPTLREILDHRDVKARYLLTIISQRMRHYHNTKGSKLPSHFTESMIVITPQNIGEESDPRMPLNYAHGEPVENNATDPAYVSDVHPSSQSAVEPDSGYGSNAFHLNNHFAQPFVHTTNTWVPSYAEYSPWPQNCGSQFDSEASNLLYPGYYSGTTMSTTPNDSRSTSYVASQAGDPVDIDPQLLQIDWTLWDSIFPPLGNDGMLDIPDDFV
ncbi:fungal-specific transcription factor domain-containing protein [Aspergillus crustosus]